MAQQMTMSKSSAVNLTPPRHPRIRAILESNLYNIFILILTIYSLVIMVLNMLMPKDSPAWGLASFFDNAVCFIFLFDFAMHVLDEPFKEYFIGKRGYFDLLGSIPSFGFSQYTVLLRLFRLSRLTRLRRLQNPDNRKLLVNEILNNRGAYAFYLTVLTAIIILSLADIFVLYFEAASPDANITTGGDAVWWSIVTITTVGYGDKYPVTAGGRTTATFVMVAGIGIIGALASILASILVPPPKTDEEPKPAPADGAPSELQTELAAMKSEMAAMRQLLEKLSPPGGGSPT